MATQTQLPAIESMDESIEETIEIARVINGVVEIYADLELQGDELYFVDSEQLVELTLDNNLTNDFLEGEAELKDRTDAPGLGPRDALLLREIMRTHGITDPSLITEEFLQNSLTSRREAAIEARKNRGVDTMSPEEFRERVKEAKATVHRLARS